MKHVLKPLAKSVLIPLKSKAAASATDSSTQKKLSVSCMTTLTISYEEMDDIMKIVRALEESGLLIKGFSKTIKNEGLDFLACY